MKKQEKAFPVKLYAATAFFAVLAVLVLLVTLNFRAKYTAYHPEAVAQAYTDTIIQSGDGYNAYKYSLVSVNDKYGDFIRKQYMYPLIYRDTAYQPGDDISEQGYTGYNDAAQMGETSKTDDGSLQGKVISMMYPYFLELIENGWDDYDTIFKSYFQKYAEVRASVFGDKYLTDEMLFTALESNVRTYGKSLTGTQDVFDENTGNQIEFRSTGKYQTAFGADYALQTVSGKETDLDLEAYRQATDAAKLKIYGVSPEDITAAKAIVTEVHTADGKTAAQAKVVVVQIKNSWYVDNTLTNTAALYHFV